ncbi:hypothetical protein D9M71_407500 [compost metagenome]
MDFGILRQFHLRHHRISIRQLHLDRQLRHGHPLGRQWHWRAIAGASEDKHRVVRLNLVLQGSRQFHPHFQASRHRCRLGSLHWRATQALGGAVDPPLQGPSRCITFWQLRQQALPVVDGFLIALAFKRGNTAQAQAGHFVGVGFQRFVSQRLQLRAPLLVGGEVLGLGPLPQQFRLATGQGHCTLEDARGIGRALLGHVGPAKEIHGLGRIRLGLHHAFKARGHFFHRLGSLGKLLGQRHLVGRPKMQVQPQRHQRYQYRSQQRQGLAQMPLARGLGAFGIGQQLAGSLVPALGHLRLIEHTGGLLGRQLGDTFLVKGHVQGRAVFFLLATAATQDREQQKAEGSEQQKARAKPEFNHGSVLFPAVWRDARVLRQTTHRRLARP